MGFDLIIGGQSAGWFTLDELPARLEQYRSENPDDTAFARVRVIQLPERGVGTAGHERSVFDFVPERPDS